MSILPACGLIINSLSGTCTCFLFFFFFNFSSANLTHVSLSLHCRIIQNRVLVFILGAIILVTIILAVFFNLRGHWSPSPPHTPTYTCAPTPTNTNTHLWLIATKCCSAVIRTNSPHESLFPRPDRGFFHLFLLLWMLFFSLLPSLSSCFSFSSLLFCQTLSYISKDKNGVGGPGVLWVNVFLRHCPCWFCLQVNKASVVGFFCCFFCILFSLKRRRVSLFTCFHAHWHKDDYGHHFPPWVQALILLWWPPRGLSICGAAEKPQSQI